MADTLEPVSGGRSVQRAPATGDVLRRILHGLLLFSMAGTLTELVLLEHTETWIQLVPLAMLALGLLIGGVAFLLPTRVLLHALRITMIAFLAAGLAGLYFHYSGNAEFELERRPGLAGWELLRRTLQGATPALAPGVMIQLALMGLLVTFRHPRLSRQASLASGPEQTHP